MPKEDIDYTNTIIYKITCKDQVITDKYVGHTTNFVQRKHAHKQSSCNEKNVNYDNKLYRAIRNHGGWTNWKMEIVGFYDCKNHYEARVKEQEHYVALQATLNSIEPLKPPKVVIPNKERRETKVDYKCDTCNYKCLNNKVYKTHLLTRKHEKNLAINADKQKIVEPITSIETTINDKSHKITKRRETTKSSEKFRCEKCDYNTSRKSQYDRHLLTDKHVQTTNSTFRQQKVPTHTCVKCNKEYQHHSSLWKHSKICTQTSDGSDVKSGNNESMVIIRKLLTDNTELRNFIFEQSKTLIEQASEHKKETNDIINKVLAISTQPVNMTQNNTTTNNHQNNKFNINMFLNEECKDAMNFDDFIMGIEVTQEDIQNNGRLGFVDGIAKIIIDNLKIKTNL